MSAHHEDDQPLAKQCSAGDQSVCVVESMSDQKETDCNDGAGASKGNVKGSRQFTNV